MKIRLMLLTLMVIAIASVVFKTRRPDSLLEDRIQVEQYADAFLVSRGYPPLHAWPHAGIVEGSAHFWYCSATSDRKDIALAFEVWVKDGHIGNFLGGIPPGTNVNQFRMSLSSYEVENILRRVSRVELRGFRFEVRANPDPDFKSECLPWARNRKRWTAYIKILGHEPSNPHALATVDAETGLLLWWFESTEYSRLVKGNRAAWVKRP